MKESLVLDFKVSPNEQDVKKLILKLRTNWKEEELNIKVNDRSEMFCSANNFLMIKGKESEV